MELYDDEFLIDRIIKNIDKTGSKLSVIKPTFERKNKKTFITNYMELCKSLCNKESTEEHILKKSEELRIFLENEMNLITSILSSGTLSIERIHQDKDIMTGLTKYINAYIICSEPKCKSGKTEIIKTGKLYFLTCKTCSARKTIEPIKKK